MTEKKGVCDTLQEMLADQVVKNGQALISNQLLYSTFPGGQLEINVFCAVHGFECATSNHTLLIVNNPFPDIIVEKQN